VEALYQHLQKQGDWDRATRWQDLINDYFLEAGIGWRMVNGLLETRGPEAFVAAVDTARNTLHETKLPTARQEIHEALRDLSRRPEPDLTGAIHHAIKPRQNSRYVYGWLSRPDAEARPFCRAPDIGPAGANAGTLTGSEVARAYSRGSKTHE
jgi:hypothetical protein